MIGLTLQLLIIFFIVRVISLMYSISNERKLKKAGALQYGKTNSLLLSLAHVFFYLGAFYEAYIHKVEFDTLGIVGALLILVSFLVLLYVIRALGGLWTVKIYIHPEHRIQNSFLFRVFKHPNYYLSIVPELIGITLLCKSWYTFAIIIPLYVLFLYIRIVQEERAMAHLYK